MPTTATAMQTPIPAYLNGEFRLVLLTGSLCSLGDGILTRLVKDIITPSRGEVETLVPGERVELVHGLLWQLFNLEV